MEGLLAFLAFALSSVLFALKRVDKRYAMSALAAGLAFALANIPNF